MSGIGTAHLALFAPTTCPLLSSPRLFFACLTTASVSLSSGFQLSIAGISNLSVCLAYVALRRGPIIHQGCAVVNLLQPSRSFHPPRPRKPRCSVPFDVFYLVEPPTFIGQAPRGRLPRNSSIWSHSSIMGVLECDQALQRHPCPRSVPGLAPTELLLAVPTRLFRTCDAREHTAWSRIAPGTSCSLGMFEDNLR